MKHWLKGEQEGKTEVFIDNLPGGPDNINLAPDGSFWIALLQVYRTLPFLTDLSLDFASPLVKGVVSPDLRFWYVLFSLDPSG